MNKSKVKKLYFIDEVEMTCQKLISYKEIERYKKFYKQEIDKNKIYAKKECTGFTAEEIEEEAIADFYDEYGERYSGPYFKVCLTEKELEEYLIVNKLTLIKTKKDLKKHIEETNK